MSGRDGAGGPAPVDAPDDADLPSERSRPTTDTSSASVEICGSPPLAARDIEFVTSAKTWKVAGGS